MVGMAAGARLLAFLAAALIPWMSGCSSEAPKTTCAADPGLEDEFKVAKCVVGGRCVGMQPHPACPARPEQAASLCSLHGGGYRRVIQTACGSQSLVWWSGGTTGFQCLYDSQGTLIATSGASDAPSYCKTYATWTWGASIEPGCLRRSDPDICTPSASGSVADAAVPSGPLGLLQCQDLSRRAEDAVLSAAASVVQCAADSDCARLDVESPCWLGCATSSLAGNHQTRAAIDSSAAEVDSLCAAYRAGGCYTADSTDKCYGTAMVGSAYRCAAGKCVFADPTTCNDLSQAAIAIVKNAADSVDQCQVDADCQMFGVPSPCWDSCGQYYAGNQSTRDAIAAQQTAVAAVCDRFTRSGCVYLPSGCPPPPAISFRCDNRRCVLTSFSNPGSAP
jgi:hypothetical protein